MTTITDVYGFLAAGLRDDPLLCLAQAVAWLDPFWSGLTDDDFNDDGSLAEALDVTRNHFPGIYALVVEALHRGATYDDLDRLICAEISRQGIPLESLEEMGYGIPMPAYGAALHDPDFYNYHPDVLPVLKMFGIEPGEDAYQVEVQERVYAAGHHLYDSLVEHPDERYRQVGYLIGWICGCSRNSSILCGIQNPKSSSTDELAYPVDLPEKAYTAARIIADDLAEHPDEHYRQVSWLIQWLFGISQNSCVDWSPEVMYEIQPLSWETEDIAFAIEIIEEAETIMADTAAGLQWLLSEPAAMLALWNNIWQIYRAPDKRPDKKPRVHLTWPEISSQPCASISPDGNVLQ